MQNGVFAITRECRPKGMHLHKIPGGQDAALLTIEQQSPTLGEIGHYIVRLNTTTPDFPKRIDESYDVRRRFDVEHHDAMSPAMISECRRRVRLRVEWQHQQFIRSICTFNMSALPGELLMLPFYAQPHTGAALR